MFLIVLTGCAVNGGDNVTCDGPYDPSTLVLVRDPDSGVCHEVSTCVAPGSEMPALDQATCSGSCEALAETACLATASCRAAYIGGASSSFLGCWSTAPSGPIQAGACVGLDAHSCSRHDNCTAWYVEPSPGVTQFDHCAEEPLATP